MSLLNIRDPKTVCYVKVIQNRKVPESFDMRMTLYPLKRVDVTIVTPNRIQLGAIVQEMKKVYGLSKFAFRVQFNWTNVPKEIKKDAYFKAEIYNIFQNAPAVKSFVTVEQFETVVKGGELPVEINHSDDNIVTVSHTSFDKDSVGSYVDLVRTHIVDFGSAPDFKNRSPKNVKKIHNYVKNICAIPHMPEETALLIVDAL